MLTTYIRLGKYIKKIDFLVKIQDFFKIEHQKIHITYNQSN